LTEAERIARAQRADAAWDEFFAPMLDELDSVYAERLVDVANTELGRDKRADKITALSHALKITKTLRTGMQAIIRDGEMAHREMLRADRVENMTAPQRRLFNMAPR
jgi:hypothetical protein